MLLGKLVKWVPLGLQRPNIYQLFTLNLMKPCLKFAPEATFKQMYSTCSSFKQSFQVVRQQCCELQLETISHLIFRLHIQTKKFGQKVMDLPQRPVFDMTEFALLSSKRLQYIDFINKRRYVFTNTYLLLLVKQFYRYVLVNTYLLLLVFYLITMSIQQLNIKCIG